LAWLLLSLHAGRKGKVMAEPGWTQVIVVVVFIAALLAVQVLVRRNAGGLGKRLARGRDLHLIEVLSIGPNERLSVVETGGQRIIVLTGRQGAGALLSLGPMASASGEDGQ
jgi:flagellar biogenesis protein FliO